MLAQNPFGSVPIGWEQVFADAKYELELAAATLATKDRFFPPPELIFHALDLCPLNQVRVVILGQDPYHNLENGRPQAIGLAFATSRGCKLQPSVANIYKELTREYGFESMKAGYTQFRNWLRENYRPEEGKTLTDTGLTEEQIRHCIEQTDEQIAALAKANAFVTPSHGDLSAWARQGVLLLNSSLTVTPGQPGSHPGVWNGVISRILEAIERTNPDCIYLLWGRNAQTLGNKVKKAIKLMASHPSPFSFSVGGRDVPAFDGCDHFKQVNKYLTNRGQPPIDWRILE